ncbi:MAG: substrate-binding domain-containing protein, partial [Hymenobacteraceae bacterium]|nr:substrate-binding domain-containing protein [Hymenobacteraceae bacterium]MDX5442363.1 substrate-binding domain-containing protein [Hymenobacteraceae bacterium]
MNTLAACNNNGGKTTETDNATHGTINISVDEAFAPIVDTQINTFEGIYKYANINAEYKPEGKVFEDLLSSDNRVRLVIASRMLTPNEQEAFKEQQITPRITKIAIDGVAIIVNNANPDTVFTLEELRKIFSGDVRTWKQLNPKSPLDSITIVFDNNSSSSARYIKDSLIHTQQLPPNTFASQSHPALIDYVAQNKNAVGVIGVNWISDFDDKNAMAFLKKIK